MNAAQACQAADAAIARADAMGFALVGRAISANEWLAVYNAETEAVLLCRAAARRHLRERPQAVGVANYYREQAAAFLLMAANSWEHVGQAA